jgi:hypothetical protein
LAGVVYSRQGSRLNDPNTFIDEFTIGGGIYRYIRFAPDRDGSVPFLEQGQKGNWLGNLSWGNPVIRKREQAQHINAIRRVQNRRPAPQLLDFKRHLDEHDGRAVAWKGAMKSGDYRAPFFMVYPCASAAPVYHVGSIDPSARVAMHPTVIRHLIWGTQRSRRHFLRHCN